MTLPAGYRLRPAHDSDAGAVAAMINAESEAVLGTPIVTPAFLLEVWRNPSVDRDRAVVETESGEPCGYLLVRAESPYTATFTLGVVALSHRERGLGAALVAEAELRARRLLPLAGPGRRVVVRAGTLTGEPRAAALLAASGYREVRRFWLMRTEFEGGVPPVPAVEGAELRPVTPADARAMHAVHLEAFADHWGEEETPLEGFLHHSVEAPDFDPKLWLVAVAGGSVVGYVGAVEEAQEDASRGYVKLLGVRRAYRRRGVGQALLLRVFGELAARGKAGCDLHVDSASPTGATRLYERVGMTAYPRFTTWEKELRPASR